MSRMTECGNLPPAKGRQAYCPVCEALVACDGEESSVDVIFDRLDRIHKLRAAYGRRRR